jgi:hypothetical protein
VCEEHTLMTNQLIHDSYVLPSLTQVLLHEQRQRSLVKT